MMARHAAPGLRMALGGLLCAVVVSPLGCGDEPTKGIAIAGAEDGGSPTPVATTSTSTFAGAAAVRPGVLASRPSPEPLPAERNLLFTTTTEWQSPSMAAGFDPAEPYTPVAHSGDSTYYVWVDAAFRPWVTQLTNGAAVTAPVDAAADYKVQPDGHHRFSLGVDKDGYVHVAGDMHHYSTFTDAVINPYPARYQKQAILYWRSNQSQSVAAGFSFAGGVGASTAIPGGGWMMGRFFTDNLGELYYSSMVHAYEAPSVANKGQMAVGLYRYARGTRTWAALGGLADAPADPYLSNMRSVLYWENAGMSGGWFQNYQARFQFDATNHLHFTVSGNTSPDYAGADRLLYAVSSDGGATWHKANGSRIPGLPLRGKDGTPNLADVVGDSGAAATFQPGVGLAIDRAGTPAVAVPVAGHTGSTWYVWGNGAWTTNSRLNDPLPLLPPSFAYRVPSGDLFFMNMSPGAILRTASIGETPLAYGFDTPRDFSTPDETALRTSGTLYGVTKLDGQTAPAISKTTVKAAPLPAGWSELDVTERANAYRTSAAYSDGTFTLYDFASDGTNNQVDDLHFTYMMLACDGTITARINMPLPGNARAGLLMRESLATDARFVGAAISLQGGAYSFAYRATARTYPVALGVAGAKTGHYLKLQRSGTLFTAAASADGQTWQPLGQTTLTSSPALYVGLYSASGQNGYYMQTTLFDKVSITGPCIHFAASTRPRRVGAPPAARGRRVDRAGALPNDVSRNYGEVSAATR